MVMIALAMSLVTFGPCGWWQGQICGKRPEWILVAVQHHQVATGKPARPLFGLLSGGDHFNFYRLYECKYCCLELRWFIPEHRERILDLLAKLCREALEAATPRGSEAMETTSG
ncbi:hypothetical protein BO82DRAFT_400630 [Aspergillus uvarum CBS 121591]|uniref:Secreted protein n=1 Tax=Aspergillus uvarum CBS 121591 TaxID=1448315 RepID=A0A319CBM0_9EURO|nr:hypothetical protein BO82DRAFT_400630 [Aspergillus uvarum CBS 121591]PYH83236.1 hypothetical protein BO82DRAFT_400630 [Aspergillus uvarum CBS 121591]